MESIINETKSRIASNAASKDADKKEERVEENYESALILEELPKWVYEYIQRHNNAIRVMDINNQYISIKGYRDLLEPLTYQ